jgi:S1-C subfamily serine protease
MASATPIFVSAGERERGCVCPRCGQTTERSTPIAVCAQCGTVHHRFCWEARGGCGSYNCAPGKINLAEAEQRALRITADEIQRAQPLPSRRVAPPTLPVSHLSTLPRTNGLAIAAFITAVIGIPLFGVLTGLVAIVLGSLALGALRTSNQRGTGLAFTGVLLGLFDVVGWIVFLSIMLSRPGPSLTFDEFEYDPAALKNLGPVLSRAMRATVLIESKAGRGLFAGTATGTGVVLQLSPAEALIVTNRHVIDPQFSGGDDAPGPGDLPPVRVRFIGRPAVSGTVTWRAPHGIDLALVKVKGDTSEARTAFWGPNQTLRVGDAVFAIGNPHRLGWTHTQGSISQLRRQRMGEREIRIIQTSTPLNPGNSVGGLFDSEGHLLGINTWSNDKRVSEGISFAIALETLLDLNPPGLGTPPPEPPPEKQ